VHLRPGRAREPGVTVRFQVDSPHTRTAKPVRPELVLLIGLPASGKTTFFQTRFALTHTQVSKDLLRHRRDATRQNRECIEASLRRGTSVVVDNTNATVRERATWLALGRSVEARLVGYYFDTPLQECLARNRQRRLSQRVPDVAIYATAARFEKPTVTEGFDELQLVRILQSGGIEQSPMTPNQEFQAKVTEVDPSVRP